MEEDLRVSQNPSPLGRWTWNLALPKPLPPLLSPIVCHRESTESSRDDIISLSSFLHIVPCLFLLKSKERKPWQILATLVQLTEEQLLIKYIGFVSPEILLTLWQCAEIWQEMWNWWPLRSFRDHCADEEQLLAMCKEFLHLPLLSNCYVVVELAILFTF